MRRVEHNYHSDMQYAITAPISRYVANNVDIDSENEIADEMLRLFPITDWGIQLAFARLGVL